MRKKRKDSAQKERYYAEVLRLHFEEGYGRDRIGRIIPVGHTTISQWIANFVSKNGTDYRAVMKREAMEKERERLASADKEALETEVVRLRAELERERMRSEAYNAMIDIAEKRFNIPIRKKSGAKR